MNEHRSYCPSCGKEATDIYCAHCGEKVKMDKSELGLTHFLKDAFEEVFNFDSKFITTIRSLLFKPGFLTNEIIAGRRINYIKPFRLYIIIVVVHFLAFSFFKSGDLFSIDRFPVFKSVPVVHHLITRYELQSGLSPELFTETLNQKIKDNLNIIFYFLVFLLALYLKLVYWKSGRYYMEHLYYVMHLITFGLLRNIVIIPLLVFDLFWLALVISIITQLTYTFISLKEVYHESNSITALKVFVVMTGFLLVFIPGLLLSLAIGIAQILF